MYFIIYPRGIEGVDEDIILGKYTVERFWNILHLPSGCATFNESSPPACHYKPSVELCNSFST